MGHLINTTKDTAFTIRLSSGIHQILAKQFIEIAPNDEEFVRQNYALEGLFYAQRQEEFDAIFEKLGTESLEPVKDANDTANTIIAEEPVKDANDTEKEISETVINEIITNSLNIQEDIESLEDYLAEIDPAYLLAVLVQLSDETFVEKPATEEEIIARISEKIKNLKNSETEKEIPEIPLGKTLEKTQEEFLRKSPEELENFFKIAKIEELFHVASMLKDGQVFEENTTSEELIEIIKEGIQEQKIKMQEAFKAEVEKLVEDKSLEELKIIANKMEIQFAGNIGATKLGEKILSTIKYTIK